MKPYFKHIARRVLLFLSIGISAAAAQTVQLSVPDTSYTQVLYFNLPVFINDVSSLGITSAQFTLSFNPIALVPQGVVTAGSLSNGWIPAGNIQPGNITVAIAGANPLADSGVLVFVRFKVQRNAPIAAYPLTLSDVLFNDTIGAQIDNGSFKAIARPMITIGGLPQQGIIGGESALLTAGGAVPPPYRWSMLSDTNIAAVDSVTGLFRAKKRGNAIVSVVDTNGFDGIDSIFVSDFRASVSDTSTTYNDVVDVPLRLSDITGLGILSAQFEIAYDTTNIRLVLIDTANTMSGGMLMAVRDTLEKISLAFSRTTPLTGSGIFVKLRFASKGLSAVNSITPLNLVKFDANESGPAYRFAARVDGSVFVKPLPNNPPVFTNKLVNTTISENQPFTFQLAASDADGDSLIYGLFNAPSGMSFNPKQGLISWTPGFTQAGVYNLRYDVGDYHVDGVVSDSAVITVLNVNRPPLFTTIFDSVTITERQQFSFSVKAVDQDSDLVGFFIRSAPAGMNINSTTGVLTWQPSFSQAGVHNFVIGVHDSKPDTTKKNVKITVKDSVTTANRPPVFLSVMPDVTIGIDSLFTFRYTASDPDGDRLIFSFAKSRTGAMLDSIGNFSWKPVSADLGVDTFIIAVSDGSVSIRDTALITVFGFPRVQISQMLFDFGSLGIGAAKTLTALIKNGGYAPLIINSLPAPVTSANFSFDSSLIKTIAPGDSQSFAVTFAPTSAGTHGTIFSFTTNDPLHPFLAFSAQGTSIAKAAFKKKVLVDATHNSSVPLRDSLIGMTKLFSSLSNSGITVAFAETTLAPAGYDAVLIVSPQTSYTAAERTALKQFVVDGGLVVMMGDANNEPGTNAVLNSLLSDTSWTTGLSLMENLVADSTHHYLQNPNFPIVTQFVDNGHPYLHSVDSLVLFNSSSMLATGVGIPFGRFTAPAVEVTGGGSTQAAIGLSKIVKGKLLVFGDASLWQNGMPSQLFEQLNIDAKDNLKFALNVFSVMEDYEVKMPAPTPNEAYQLVSIPFDLQNAEIATVLQGLGGVNPLVWRLFGKFDPAAGMYAEFPSPGFNSFRRGEAYWLITRGEFDLNFGNATVLPAQDFFPINIGPGYSMIGNPFPYKVSWANSLKGDSVQATLYKFSPALNDFVAETQTLDPFTGYFVKNLSQDSVTIFINPLDVSSLAKQTIASSLSNEEWRISIGASSGKARDSENYAGVSSLANDELDRLDAAEPPSTPTDYVVVRFNNPSWKKQSGSYAVDIRPIAEEGVFWDLDVTTAKKQSKVSLSLASLGTVPADFVVYLIDKKTERAIRVDQTSVYDFTMGKNEHRREFRLVAGRKEFVESNTGGIPLVPKEFALGQNFPNPFNPSTTIRYTVGHSGDVSVTIYNVLGQKIRTLMNEFHSIGSYDVEWDAKDDRGIGVATGVYFYRITVMSQGERLFNETKKAVLMK